MDTISMVTLLVIAVIFIIYMCKDTQKISKKLDLAAKNTCRYKSSEILNARAKNHGENIDEIKYQNRGEAIINDGNFIRLVKKGVKIQ